MKLLVFSQLCSVLFVGAVVNRVTAAEVDFASDIAPIFRQNCVACHNSKKTEGGLNLESYEALMQGGDTGAAVTAKDLEDSYILPRVTGEEEPWMPPEDNTVGAERLTEEEVELLRRWILAGAQKSQPTTEPSSIEWGSLPENLKPVYAMASSPDGQHLAFGRGNRAAIASVTDVQQEGQPPTMDWLIDPSLSRIEGRETFPSTHLDIVQSIAFSPDSQRIATGGYRNFKIWRKKTTPEQLLTGLVSADRVAAVSPDCGHFAYQARQGGLVLVNVQKGESHRFLKAHDSPISAMAWTVAGTQLISCDEGGQWMSTQTNQYESQSLLLPSNLIATKIVAVSADRLLGLESEGRVFELQLKQGLESGTAFVRLLDHQPPVKDIAVSGDGQLLASVNGDGVVLFTHLETGERSRKITVSETPQLITLNTDGSRLLTADHEGLAKVWNTEDGSLVAELDRDYAMAQQLRFATTNITRQKLLIDLLNGELPGLKDAAQKEVEARDKLADARDKAAASLQTMQEARENADQGLRDAQQALTQAEQALAAAKKKVEEMSSQVAAKKKAVGEAEASVDSAQQELDERERALATANESVDRAEAAIPVLEERITSEKNQLDALETSLVHLEEDFSKRPTITAATFSADGKHTILAAEDQLIRVFSVDGQPTANLSATADLLTLSPDGSGSIVGLADDGKISRWNLRLGWELERTIGSYQDSPISDRVTALDFSPDGKRLAVGSGPPSRFGEIKLFDVETGALLKDFGEPHTDTVLALEFSPDGNHLASAAADKLSRLFDVESGQMLRAFEGHTHHVLDVSWHSNGQTLATASADNSIKLWRTETGEQLRTITGFTNEVTAVEFLTPPKTGEPSQVVSASADGMVRLHRVDNGQQVKVLNGAGDALYGLATSSDTQQVSAGGQTGKVWTWRLADASIVSELPSQDR